MISALYVDDEITLLEVTKIYLERSGEFSIDIASSVDDALPMIEDGNYDAIISDYQMPNKDGIQFLTHIRKSGKDIPFILFTGKGREDVVIQAINNGADFYIQKGGDPRSQFAELTHKLKVAVDRRSKADEIVRKNIQLEEINRRLEKAEDELRKNLDEVNKKRTELAESRERLHQIIKFLPDPTFAIDEEGRVIAWNNAMEKLSGTFAEEILGKGDYEYSYVLYGKRRPILIDLVLNPELENEFSFPDIVSKGRRKFSERSFSSLKGKKNAHLSFTAAPLYDTECMTTGAIESIRDITRIKRAQSILQRQKDLGFELGKTTTVKSAMESILRASLQLDEIDSGGIYIVDQDSGTVRLEVSEGVSDEFLNKISVLKYSDEIKETLDDFVHYCKKPLPGIKPEWLENEGISCMHAAKFRYEDKTFGFLVCSSHSVGEFSSETRASLESLTSQASSAIFRIKMSEERRSLRENLESFFDEIEDYLYVVDSSGKILMTNSSLQKYTGYEESELFGSDLSILHPPEYHDEIGIVINGIIEGNLGSHFIPIINKNGETIPVETRVSPGTWAGQPAIFAVTRNVSDLRVAHDKLLESERRLRAVFDQSFQLAAILDKKGRILDINKTALNLVGSDIDSLKGKILYEAFSDDFSPIVREKLSDAVMVASKGVSLKSEIKVPDRDGLERYLDLSLRFVKDEKGAVEYLIPEAVDITRRKRAEEALLQANHKLILLNSITRHDILNKITPVLGYLEMADMANSSPKIAEIIEKAEVQVLDIDRLIRFTKLYDELGSAGPCWQDMEGMLNSLRIPPEISFNNKVSGIEVFADPMLEKVFSNFLDNSIRHGRKVTEISVSGDNTDEGLSILWRDNGVGVPEENKEKIFLRGFGENSGLGLFLSREILSITDIVIRECGEEGKGAVFEIIVPPGESRIVGTENGDDQIENI